MEKQQAKLYLDTSVINYIDAPHRPEAEAITRAFFRFVAERDDEYELVVSPVVEFEVGNCPEPKQSLLIALMESLPIVHLSEDQEAFDLAKLYVEHNVLARKHIRDLTHVAYATVSRCDFVISWNMKHLANVAHSSTPSNTPSTGPVRQSSTPAACDLPEVSRQSNRRLARRPRGRTAAVSVLSPGSRRSRRNSDRRS